MVVKSIEVPGHQEFMVTRILQGNVFDVLPTITPGSVDCCVTSPPYWALRNYLPKDHPLKHFELGTETTPQDYVVNMVKVFDLVRNVLADWGTVWLNVGDSYRDGNLCLIPQRLAIALQDRNWIVRSVICWHKPSPMPLPIVGWRWTRCKVKVKGYGTVTGRKGTEHENRAAAGLARRSRGIEDPDLKAQYADCPGCPKCSLNGGLVLRRGSWRPTSSWEPILMLAKTLRYFGDGEATKTIAAAATVSRDKYTRIIDDPDEQFAVKHDHETKCLSGANLRDVWKIPHESLLEKHYAAFPSELVHRCLKAGTSAKGYCVRCGMPWTRCLAVKDSIRKLSRRGTEKRESGLRTSCDGAVLEPAETTTTGWRPSCTCDAGEPRPALVLDPFCGSGRTGIEARRLGLDFVGCELNPEYVVMATKLLANQSSLFADM